MASQEGIHGEQRKVSVLRISIRGLIVKVDKSIRVVSSRQFRSCWDTLPSFLFSEETLNSSCVIVTILHNSSGLVPMHVKNPAFWCFQMTAPGLFLSLRLSHLKSSSAVAEIRTPKPEAQNPHASTPSHQRHSPVRRPYSKHAVFSSLVAQGVSDIIHVWIPYHKHPWYSSSQSQEVRYDEFACVTCLR